MQDAKSVIVYGPQGCGKTRNADALVKHFGVRESVDLEESLIRGSQLKQTGVLYLTSRTPEELISDGFIDRDARRVFSFDEAMRMMEPVDTKDWMDIDVNDEPIQGELSRAGTMLTMICHGASLKAGWWSGGKYQMNPLDEVRNNTRVGKALVAEKLCLIHSEISEAMEGHRKGLQDDKLPHRAMIEVELADALIRICDLAGALDMDLGGAVAEKMKFNAVRPDHKKEAREAAGGKAY